MSLVSSLVDIVNANHFHLQVVTWKSFPYARYPDVKILIWIRHFYCDNYSREIFQAQLFLLLTSGFLISRVNKYKWNGKQEKKYFKVNQLSGVHKKSCECAYHDF